MELGSAIVWDVDSQEGVDFSEPSPPGCGFHAISPVLPDFAGLEKYGLDAWNPIWDLQQCRCCHQKKPGLLVLLPFIPFHSVHYQH